MIHFKLHYSAKIYYLLLSIIELPIIYQLLTVYCQVDTN